MPFATVRDLNVHYVRDGSGEPLLFISGTGSDLRVKPGIMDGPLPKSFDVLAYDQRGLGQTSKPDVAYSMADYADDAAGLMDAIGWDSAHVAGFSFGGMVAQELALRHPRRIRRLVLGCTSPGGAGGSSYPFHEIGHLTGEARAKHMIPISDTRRDEGWAKANPDQYAQFVAMAAAADPYADEPGRALGAWRQIEARSAHDAWDRLPQIACPTLIAAGRYDGVAKPAAQEAMASRIPGAELRFFDGGHMFFIQDRAAWPAMVDFLTMK